MTEIKTKCVESSKLGGGEGAGYRAVAGGWAVYQLLMPLSRVGGGGNGRRTQQEHSEPLQSLIPITVLLSIMFMREGGKKLSSTPANRLGRWGWEAKERRGRDSVRGPVTQRASGKRLPDPTGDCRV